MNILCITHADFETPGVIETWAQDHGHSFLIATPYKTPDKDILVDESYDFLIVMGGPQSPLEMEKDPYLKYEIALIKNAIKENKPVLGFCLGAQLIGEALGAVTARSPEKEVGVFPITLANDARDDSIFYDFPKTFPVIHWHNDMPGLTNESKLLAFSQGCPRQILRYKSNVYGLQCHLEITRDGIATMIKAVPGDLKPSRFTQTEAELLSYDYNPINETMVRILERMTQKNNKPFSKCESRIFILSLKYKKTIQDIETNREIHWQYLQKHYESGTFLMSGRNLSMTGGFIIAKGVGRTEIENIIKEDPFLYNGLVDYEIGEFTTTKCQLGLENYIK